MAAAWNAAVSSVGTRTNAMVVAYLREAIAEAERSTRVPLDASLAALAEPERRALRSIVDGEERAAENVWLFLRATFLLIQAAYKQGACGRLRGKP